MMNGRLAFACALALLMLASPIFAQGTPGSSIFFSAGKCFLGAAGDTNVNPVSNMDRPIVIAVAIMIVLIAVAHMGGEAFHKPEWSVWAKNEMVTLLFSLALMFAVVGAFVSSCTISQEITGTKASDAYISPSMVASTYLEGLINKFGSSIAVELVQSSIKDQFNSMPYAYWGFPWDPGGGGGTGYKASMRAWSAHKEMLAGMYTPVIASIKAQKLIMDALYLGIASVLLPVAIFLRFIFVTRDIGNFLLALCFAVYFFFPLTFVLAQAATDNVVIEMKGTPTNPFGSLKIAEDKFVRDSYQKIGFLTVQAVLVPNLALVVMATATMGLYKAFRGFVA